MKYPDELIERADALERRTRSLARYVREAGDLELARRCAWDLLGLAANVCDAIFELAEVELARDLRAGADANARAARPPRERHDLEDDGGAV